MSSTLWRDLRYGARQLRQSPGFAAVAILSLGLGIGANSAIFQLFDAVRLRALPVARPSELAAVRIAGGTGGHGISDGYVSNVSNPLWEQIRDRQQAFSGAFAWGSAQERYGPPASPRRLRSLWVSGEAFAVLGLPPAHGRLLDTTDDRRGCAPRVVLSYGFWQSEFGGSADVIGRALSIDDQLFEVIGVTPASFFGLEVGRNFDTAMPICAQAAIGNQAYHLERRDVWWLSVFGRLKPGWTRERASAQLAAISPGAFEATSIAGLYSEQSQKEYLGYRLEADPAAQGISSLRDRYDRSLWLLLGMTGLVLLIACANLANLLLARAGSRRREIAIRLALGASRERLVRQLLAESLLLASLGATVGVGLAQVLSRGIVWFLGSEGSLVEIDLGLDWRILGFTIAVTLLTAAAFGLAPAIRASRSAPGEAMKVRGATAGRERFSFQRLLVISQVAISLVLLAASFLFLRSFRNLITYDPGFHRAGISTLFVNFAPMRLPAERRIGVQQDILARVQSVGQVESAASSTIIPLNGASWTMSIRLPEAEGSSKVTWTSPGYFRTLGIPFLRGRDFAAADTRQSTPVAIVNETFVRRLFHGADPIGKTFRTVGEPKYPETLYEIVGVVKDTKYGSLRQETPAQVYAPAVQHPTPGPVVAVLIRSQAGDIQQAVRRALESAYPDVSMGFSVLETDIRSNLIRERLMAALSGFFGALAGVLAGIGLYGVISYIVVSRRNEIGIRMALGASRGRVIGGILSQAGGWLAAGIVVGTGLSLVAIRGASTLLFGVEPNDPATLIAAAGALALVTAIASYIPARRASRLDPMTALRQE